MKPVRRSRLVLPTVLLLTLLISGCSGALESWNPVSSSSRRTESSTRSTTKRDNEKQGAGTAEQVSFYYPDPFPTTYIEAIAWPPTLERSNDPFTCNTSTAPSSPNQTVTQTMINNLLYCVNTTSEGAAGSIYRTYEYITRTENKLQTWTFTLRFPECTNYEEPEQSECTAEAASLDLNEIIGRLTATVKTSSSQN